MAERLPLVWVPGHLCGPWLYAPQRAVFGGRVHAHGMERSLETMASRLLAEAPPRFVVAGLSMGAMVAMAAMARAPERIAGALLMATDPTAVREKEISWRRKAVASGLDLYVSGFVHRFFAHDRQVAARHRATVERLMNEVPEPVARAQIEALDHRGDLLPGLRGVAAPVEVLVGGADAVCPPKLHLPIAEVCRNARLTVVPACGHLASLERPDEVGARLAVLLARVGAG